MLEQRLVGAHDPVVLGPHQQIDFVVARLVKEIKEISLAVHHAHLSCGWT
jgi:hypothetical protein